MPKQAVNMSDFSGGLNTKSSPRDIDNNQAQDIDGLMSYEKGVLALRGGFIRPRGFTDYMGGFREEAILMGIPNSYPVSPEFSFVKFGYAVVTVSSDVATFTHTGFSGNGSSFHGIATGTNITIIEGVSTVWKGKVFTITNTGDSTFTVTGATGLPNISILYAVGADFVDFEQMPYKAYEHKRGAQHNQFILKASRYNIFGFYNAGYPPYWVSANDEENTNHWGGNPWLFDTKYLWDWKQAENPTALLVADDKKFEDFIHYDAFYDSGVIRVAVEPSGTYNLGTCRRPVNYQFIPERNHFYSYYIKPGWYPLRSHILSIHEYLNPESMTHVPDAGTITLEKTATTLSTFDTSTLVDGSNFIETNALYRFKIGVGNSDDGDTGDWQFNSGIHRKIGLGVSLIYDTMTFDLQQESPITYCKDTQIMSTCADDTALDLYIKVYRGKTLTGSSNEIQQAFGGNTNDANTALADIRGSGLGPWQVGFSNSKAWNPRIVGVNVWLTHDFSGELDDPFWLAQFPFEKGEKGSSHDGVKSTAEWGLADNDGGSDYSHQLIQGIKSIPGLSYVTKNEYGYDDMINCWYKTSAVINMRLYAGNVSYFNQRPSKYNDANNLNKTMDYYPDRIIRSPRGKYDVLPDTHFIDVVPQDGQSIVKLIAFNKELLVFKDQDLFVIDCSGEIVTLIKTIRGKGVDNPCRVVQTPEAVVFCNVNGVYAYTGQGQAVNLVPNIDIVKWKNSYASHLHPAWDPEGNLVIIFCKKINGPNSDKNVFIVDLATGSAFFRSTPSIYNAVNYGPGMLLNNKLYVTASIEQEEQSDGDDNGGENAFGHEGTGHDPGERTQAQFKFKLGTGDSAVNANAPGANAQYLLLRKGTGWIPLNANAFDIVTTSDTKTEAAKFFIANATAEIASQDDYKVSFDYNPDTEYLTGTISGTSVGTALNGTAQTNPNSVSAYGTTAIAFASGTSEGNIHVSNITDFSFSGLTNGRNVTAGVFKIRVDRNGFTRSGVNYVISFIKRSKNDDSIADINSQIIYTTGHSGFYSSASSSNYADETDSGESSNTRNDRLLTNIHEYIQYNKFHSKAGNKFLITDLFTVGAIGGDSGSKSFNLTVKNQTSGDSDDYDIQTESYSGTGGELLTWDNITESIYHSYLNYETKEFDFGQPNVRKKVYKAYITYKGGDGNISVLYKIDSSNSWVSAEADTGAYLDDSAIIRRAEVTFGTGSNNIYTFALKINSLRPVQDFQIHDITLVYRIKSVK
jgi:hypothetical protein